MAKPRDPKSPSAAEMHAPVLRRLKEASAFPRQFSGRKGLPWLLVGGIALLGLMLGPVVRPQWSPWAESISTFLALFWLLTAAASVTGMRHRAPWVAFAVTLFLYAITSWLPFIGIRSLLVLTVVVGFGIFVLAGFNLLFVLEEIVYDVYRLLRVRGGMWQVIPLLLAIALIPVVFLGERFVDASLGTLQVVVPFGVAVLVIGWIIRLRAHRGEEQLREVHLLVTGAIAGAGLADAVALLRNAGGILPSVIAYMTFLGTWVYVSYTTLQRAQYFLRSSDVFPWIALLLSSSFAMLAHLHSLYEVAGEAGLQYQVDLRVGYLVVGVWIGLTFFVLRGLWRLFQFVRDERSMGRSVRRTAGKLARVTEELIRAEELVEGAATRVFQKVNRLLPGGEPPEEDSKPPRRPRKPRR